MLYVLGLTSTKATLAPVRVTASEVAIKLFAGTRTSSPCLSQDPERDKQGIGSIPDAYAVLHIAEVGKDFSNELT